jgi:hypothetical protein
MNYIALFFAGAFLCNCIPHLSSALRGRPFPTPFGKPRGIGDSAPLVNFLWGAFNFLVGTCLLSGHAVAIGFNPSFITLIVGALVMGTHLSLHFGKVRRNKSQMHAILAAGLVLTIASLLPGLAQAQTLEEQEFEQEGLAGLAALCGAPLGLTCLKRSTPRTGASARPTEQQASVQVCGLFQRSVRRNS